MENKLNRMKDDQSEVSSQNSKKSTSRDKIPFILRCKIFAYLDLVTLIYKVSHLSRREFYGLSKAHKILATNRSLLITIYNDQQQCNPHYDHLKHCISLCSRIDLRVQEFHKSNSFFLGAIISLCAQYDKMVELNIWVDTDLDVQIFVNSFKPRLYSKYLDFVYYRFDHKNFSYKLRHLMQAFQFVKDVRFQEAK